MKKPERLKEAVKLMLENCLKYDELVWYARCNPKKHPSPLKEELQQLIIEKQLKYPEETFELSSDGENSDWQHGFHSGALAFSRLYHEMIEGDIEFALENHPDLDT